jgi:L-asparaginase / beta-aspartyl-peptidase
MWAIILHGGATEIEPAEADDYRHGCLRALQAARDLLVNGGSAIDAVEVAVRSLEADPTFNAGYGSAQNSEGEVQMCSAVMEGNAFNVGAVAAIAGVRHPVSVAKAMLFEEPVLMTGPGARHFAEQKGVALCQPEDLIAHGRTRRTGTHDTVGCIALDEDGHLAVGTSTGGLDGSPPGRIGDSPQPGCGYYVDDAIGGVAFSGDGEHIARKMLAARVMHAMESGGADKALDAALAQVQSIGGEAGGIVLLPDGRFAWRHNSRDFAVAMQSSGQAEPSVFIRKQEEES